MTDFNGILYPDCLRAGTAVCKYCDNDTKCGELMLAERQRQSSQPAVSQQPCAEDKK